MNSIKKENQNNESLVDFFDSSIEGNRWQVEYMKTIIEDLESAKRKVQILMDHYRESKMNGDDMSINIWGKLDETDRKIMEGLISISEAVGCIVSEGLVLNHTQR